MEPSSQRSTKRGAAHYILNLVVAFFICLGVNRLIDYFWPPHESFWRSAVLAVFVSAILVTPYSRNILTNAMLGGAPRS
jgi:hypothetical protein